MKFNKVLVAVLFLLVSLHFVGCVRVNVQTRGQALASPEGTAPSANPFGSQTEVKKRILVSPLKNLDKGVEVILEDGDIDSIFRHANLIAQCGQGNETDPACGIFDDIENDFACKISLEPELSQTFNFEQDQHSLSCINDGVICSEYDWIEALKADPLPRATEGMIKVVRKVNWCGQPGDFWVGCAAFPGQLLGQQAVVERLSFQKIGDVITDPDKLPYAEGIMWIHEYAHTTGLYHTNLAFALNQDPSGVMAPGITLRNTKFNGQECFKLRGNQR